MMHFESAYYGTGRNLCIIAANKGLKKLFLIPTCTFMYLSQENCKIPILILNYFIIIGRTLHF